MLRKLCWNCLSLSNSDLFLSSVYTNHIFRGGSAAKSFIINGRSGAAPALCEFGERREILRAAGGTPLPRPGRRPSSREMVKQLNPRYGRRTLSGPILWLTMTIFTTAHMFRSENSFQTRLSSFIASAIFSSASRTIRVHGVSLKVIAKICSQSPTVAQ